MKISISILIGRRKKVKTSILIKIIKKSLLRKLFMKFNRKTRRLFGFFRGSPSILKNNNGIMIEKKVVMKKSKAGFPLKNSKLRESQEGWKQHCCSSNNIVCHLLSTFELVLSTGKLFCRVSAPRSSTTSPNT